MMPFLDWTSKDLGSPALTRSLPSSCLVHSPIIVLALSFSLEEEATCSPSSTHTPPPPLCLSMAWTQIPCPSVAIQDPCADLVHNFLRLWIFDLLHKINLKKKSLERTVKGNKDKCPKKGNQKGKKGGFLSYTPSFFLKTLHLIV